MALQIDLLTCVELDPRTFQVTVREQWTERRLFRTVEHERERTYTLAVRVGRWHDGEHFILNNDPRHFRLMELWAAWRIERKLDEYIEQPDEMPRVQAPSYGPLPPVPVLRK